MMLARASTFFTIALAAIAIATPTTHYKHHDHHDKRTTKRDRSGYCNTGDLKCCNVYQESENAQKSEISGLLDIPIELLTGNIGIGCISLDVLLGLLNPQSCTQQPVCCEGDKANGLIGISCIPINLNL
ncbi:fungal hydrophobin-domain-containing protein [Scleroderma yunnanense]